MFFDKLQQLCLNRGETVSAVTKKLGFSSAMPSKWRNGAMPNGNIIKKFSLYFNVSCDYLLEFTDDPIPYYNRNLSQSSNGLLLKYLRLTDDDKEKVDAGISFLLADDKYNHDKRRGGAYKTS